jgi:hypothetical protein
LEQAADLISLDEMRFPLMEFLTQKSRELIEEIPMGIHSTRKDGINGVFLAFSAKDRSIWHFYPRINGAIVTDRESTYKEAMIINEKRKIFKMIQCKEADYPNPDDLPPVEFDNAIFAVLQGAVSNLIHDFQKQQSSIRIKPSMSKLVQSTYTALTQGDLLETDESDMADKERVLKIITSINLKTFEKEIRQIWDRYRQDQNLTNLVAELDEYFIEKEIGQGIDDQEEETTLDIIKKEDVQLVCYEWFKSSS